MKKLISVFVMALFIISMVPFVLAQGTTNAPVAEVVPVRTVEGSQTQTQEERLEQFESAMKRIKGGEDGEIAKPIMAKHLPKPVKAQIKAEAGKAVRARLMSAKAMKYEENFEKIRQHQAEKLKLGVEKCQEKNLDVELCEKKFQKRVELVQKLKDKDLERIKKLELKKAETIQEITEMEEKPELAKFKAEKGFKVRTVSKAKIEKAQKTFARAEENFKKSKEKYQVAKEKFEKVKGQMKNCKDAECDVLRKQVRKNVKESLLGTTEIISNKLIQIKEKIEESDVLTENEADGSVAQLEEQLAEVEGIASELEAKEEMTKEELKDLTKRLRKILQEATKRAKKASLRVMNARIGGVIVKSKHLELKLERVLERAAENGMNTDPAKQDIDKFNFLLEEAQKSYEASLGLFKENKIQEAQKEMRKAHSKLKETHFVLKDIVSKLRELNVDEELENEEELEVEAEVDEEIEEVLEEAEEDNEEEE